VNRVLLLIKGLGRGGAEQLLVSSAPYLDRESYHYEVAYLLAWKDALGGALEARGLPVHCLRGGRGLGWAGRLRGLVRRRGIDLIHCHSPLPAVGARSALGRRVLHVYTEHNVWSRYHRATYWANAATLPRSQHVFAVSDHVRDSIRYPRPLRFRPMPPVETLYHGLDPAAMERWHAAPDGVRAELGIPADAPMAVTVANFKAHKGHEFLLEAARRVRRQVPEVRFVLVGTGQLEESVRRRAADLDLDGTLVFAGFREDAPRVAAAGDVFVLPSLHEGLSIALVEAMALGLPSVVTAVGGQPEVIEDGVQGLLVPPRDAAALARGVAALLVDSPRRERMGQAARLRAAEFDIRKSVRRTEAVYGELLA
jgi:glycosyltransferase involved in cell wall biosynthesis